MIYRVQMLSYQKRSPNPFRSFHSSRKQSSRSQKKVAQQFRADFQLQQIQSTPDTHFLIPVSSALLSHVSPRISFFFYNPPFSPRTWWPKWRASAGQGDRGVALCLLFESADCRSWLAFSAPTGIAVTWQSEIDRFELCICAGPSHFHIQVPTFRPWSSTPSGSLVNRSTSSSAHSWLARQARTSLESSMESPGNSLSTAYRLLKLRRRKASNMSLHWEQMAADPERLYGRKALAPYRPIASPSPQLPGSTRFTGIAMSGWLNFVDDLGRIERDHVWPRESLSGLECSQSCFPYASQLTGRIVEIIGAPRAPRRRAFSNPCPGDFLARCWLAKLYNTSQGRWWCSFSGF